MNGRLENKIKKEDKIKKILSDCPMYLKEWYFNLSTSHEANTCVEYIKSVKKFLIFLNPDMDSIKLDHITDMEISIFMKSIEIKVLKNGEIKQTSFAYRKLVYSALNNFLLYIYKKGIIERNPMELVERVHKKDEVKKYELSWKDLQSIYNSVDEYYGTKEGQSESLKYRDKLILAIFLNTGMRRTALTEINVEDIDFKARTFIAVDKGYKYHTYKMSDTFFATLNKWLDFRECVLSGRKSDSLFPTRQGGRISSNNVERLVKRYSKLALGYPISPHKLRGAFVTNMVRMTGDIEFVREIVGHANIQTTQRYVINDMAAKDKAADIISGMLDF